VNRSIPDPGFAGDHGAADPALAAALTRYAALASAGGDGDHGDGDHDDGDHEADAEAAVLSALSGARLLVAVVAVAADLGSTGDEPDPGTGEKGTDMALVTLSAPDGARALPAFTSVAALRAWDPRARPVPVETRRACLAALAEGAETVLVDPPQAYVLTGAALHALAEGRLPLPPERDPEVAAAVRAAVAGEPVLARVGRYAGRDADLTVALVLAEGAVAEAVREAADRVAARLSEDPVIRDRLRGGLELAVLPPGTALPAEP
jgi:hypothetical protein